LLAAAQQDCPMTALTSDAAQVDGFVELTDRLRLHYRDYPGPAERPPLLCLHGLTRNARDFAGLAERYSPGRRVIVPDFRGRGESEYDPLPARYNPLTYAGDVLQLLDRLQIAEAVFLGTSMGGLVAMTVATIAPDRIAAAILNDIGPEISPEGLERIGSYVGKDLRFASWDDAARAIAANNAHAFDRYSHDDWVAMAKRNCREERGEIRFDYDMAVAWPFTAPAASRPVDLWPLFGALAAKPLLVIRGAKSDLLSAATVEKMRAAAPNMRTAVVAGVGHAPDLDEPEAIAAIDAFLASLDAGDLPAAG
jgi:pimeloyl-ACP methyl ester carboxylesterase